MSNKRKLTPFRRKYLRFNISEQRRKLKRKSIEYKGGKCQLCGYAKCDAAMTFHHVDPTQKDFGIGDGNSRSFEKIKNELDKCILLCANCHAEEHAKIDAENRLKIKAELDAEKQTVGEPSIIKNCFTCSKQISIYASRDTEKNFCSRKCRDEHMNNLGWPNDEELLQLRQNHTVKEMVSILNKAQSAIYRRLSRLN